MCCGPHPVSFVTTLPDTGRANDLRAMTSQRHSCFQALNGLAAASGLFLIARRSVADLRRHPHRQSSRTGPLYMLGTYLAYAFATKVGGVLGFWGGIIADGTDRGGASAALDRDPAAARASISAPELFQLLATFALVLVINDATLYLWGPEDLLGPRAPGLRGAIECSGPEIARATTCS